MITRNVTIDKESAKKKKLDKQVELGINKIKMEDYNLGDGNYNVFSKEHFGLCYDCKCLYAFKTRYGTSLGKCYEFEIILDGKDVIEHCTRYDTKGQMSIETMKNMAILLEPDKKTVGFI